MRRRRGASRWLTKASSRGGRASRSVVLASTCRLAGRGVEGEQAAGGAGGAGKNLGCCFSAASALLPGEGRTVGGLRHSMNQTGPGFRRGTVGGLRHSVIGAPGLGSGPGRQATVRPSSDLALMRVAVKRGVRHAVCVRNAECSREVCAQCSALAHRQDDASCVAWTVRSAIDRCSVESGANAAAWNCNSMLKAEQEEC